MKRIGYLDYIVGSYYTAHTTASKDIKSVILSFRT